MKIKTNTSQRRLDFYEKEYDSSFIEPCDTCVHRIEDLKYSPCEKCKHYTN